MFWYTNDTALVEDAVNSVDLFTFKEKLEVLQSQWYINKNGRIYVKVIIAEKKPVENIRTSFIPKGISFEKTMTK